MFPARIVSLVACVLVLLYATCVLTDYVAFGAAESIERTAQVPVGATSCDVSLQRGGQPNRGHAIRSSLYHGLATHVELKERRSPTRHDGPAVAALLRENARVSAIAPRARFHCASFGCGDADVHLASLHCRAPPAR